MLFTWTGNPWVDENRHAPAGFKQGEEVIKI